MAAMIKPTIGRDGTCGTPLKGWCPVLSRFSIRLWQGHAGQMSGMSRMSRYPEGYVS
jgi:hypothetical protein